MRPTVVLHPVHGPGLHEELARLPGIELIAPADGDGVAAALAAGADVLVTFVWEDRYLTDGLRWVQAISAGVEQLPLGELERRGVTVTTARGAHAPAVALHAIALLLALVRGLGEAVRDAPSRSWQPKAAFEVAGSTLGVLGLGGIGEEVARSATALGMRVIGTKTTPEDYTGVADRVWDRDGTLEVCQQADALVIALPSSPGTAGVVGRRELEALGPGWLVNVGRGTVVDEVALVEALRHGPLRGAGLDVFAEEPLAADSPLWDLPNVIVTPHMAWVTDQLAPRLAEVFRRNLRGYQGHDRWFTAIAAPQQPPAP